MKFKMIICIATSLMCFAICSAASTNDLAKKMLGSAKLDQGLCVYINTGNGPSLAVDLALNSRMLINELCFDNKNEHRILSRIIPFFQLIIFFRLVENGIPF